MISIADFETALYEYLTGAGIVRVYSQAVPQEGMTPCIVLRESGSTTVNELEGPWNINTAAYEVAALVATRDSTKPEVDCKELSQQALYALWAVPSKSNLGTTKPVRIDSFIHEGQTTRQFTDQDNGGTVFLYSQRWTFNYDVNEVAA